MSEESDLLQKLSVTRLMELDEWINNLEKMSAGEIAETNMRSRQGLIRFSSKAPCSHEEWIYSLNRLVPLWNARSSGEKSESSKLEAILEEYAEQVLQALPKEYGCLKVVGDFEGVVCEGTQYFFEGQIHARETIRFLCQEGVFSEGEGRQKQEIRDSIEIRLGEAIGGSWKPAQAFRRHLLKLYKQAIGVNNKGQYWLKR